MPAISANATASTSSFVYTDTHTTSVTVTVTQTQDETVTVTASPSTVTASFYSTLTLNQTSTVAYNSSASAIRTARSGYFAASGSASGAKFISTASFYSAIPTANYNSTSTYSHPKPIATGTGAMESRSTAAVLSTMTVSSELDSSAPTATSFRSQISRGAVFGGKSASGDRFISDDITLPAQSAIPTASFYSSAKDIATPAPSSSSSAKKNVFSIGSSEIKIALTSSSQAAAASSSAAIVGGSSSSSAVTSQAVASSSPSSSAKVFGGSSSSHVNVAITSSTSAAAQSAATLTASTSTASSSASFAAIASTTAAAIIGSSSASDDSYGAASAASSSSSSHGKGKASSTATLSAGAAASTAKYSSNASAFFHSLGSSPASITGTVVVVIAIACVLLALGYFIFRCCRKRRDRHMHLGSEGAGSPDMLDEKTARGGPYTFDDEESDIHPEAIWARRLSQLHLSVANPENEEANPFSDVQSMRERQDSDDWTSFGGDQEYQGTDDLRTRQPSTASIAQIIKQQRRLSNNGTTAPPPPPAMALPKLPSGQFLTVPARPAHPLRNSVTAASPMSSPSMYSTRSDEDERRDVLTSLGGRLGLPPSPDFNPASPVQRTVMLGGSPVESDSVLPPAAPGSWKASLDQIMNTAADFVSSKFDKQQVNDIEAQQDNYTAFSNKSVGSIRRPQPAYIPSEEDLSPCSTPAMGSSALGYLVSSGKAAQSSREQNKANNAVADASPEIPAVAPLFSSRDSTSSMLALVQAAGLHQEDSPSDESDEAILTASTAASPVARSTARLVTVRRGEQLPNFNSQKTQQMERSESSSSEKTTVTASSSSSEVTARQAERPVSQADTFGRRSSYTGSEVATATEDEEGDDASDAASIVSNDSGALKRRESRVLEAAHQRRASLFLVERRRKSEGQFSGRTSRQMSVASLV